MYPLRDSDPEKAGRGVWLSVSVDVCVEGRSVAGTFTY